MKKWLICARRPRNRYPTGPNLKLQTSHIIKKSGRKLKHKTDDKLNRLKWWFKVKIAGLCVASCDILNILVVKVYLDFVNINQILNYNCKKQNPQFNENYRY